MAAPATVAQGIQIGGETTYGTAVAANRKLPSLSLSLAPNLSFQRGGPMGYKYDTYAYVTENLTDVTLDDSPLNFEDIVYALTMAFGPATITTPAGGTTSRQWEWAPNISAADVVKGFTIERGDGTTNTRAAGAILTDLGIDIARDGISVTGSGFARALEQGITLTASPTGVPQVVATPLNASLYVDAPGTDVATWDSAFGTTKLTGAREANFSVSGLRGPVWVLDAAQTSYTETVELKPDASCELTMQANATGTGFLTNAQNGDTRAVRVEVTGPQIETGVDYAFTLDYAGIIVDGGGLDDVDGVQMVPWTFGIMADTVWGKAFRIRVINTRIAL